MSKKNRPVFRVTVEGYDEPIIATSIKKVSELLGMTVTREDIESGLLPVEIVGKETVEEVDTAIQEAVAEEEVVNEEPIQEVEPITEVTEELPEDNIEPIQSEPIEEVTPEEPVLEETTVPEEVIEEPTKEQEVASEEEDEDSEEPSEEEDTEDEDSEEDDSEEDDEEEKPSYNDLLEKLRAVNAKHNVDKPAKGKKGKVKKIVFDGNFPEIGAFSEVAEIKKFYKQLDDKQLDDWLELEGWSDEYTPSEHEGINRMRKCLLIRNKHFPPVSTKKSKSKYAAYSTEDLMQIALDNDIAVKDANGDARILRMYIIMELRKAGLLE